MAADQVQCMNLLKGKRIKLTLKTTSFIGVLQRINPNRTLVLADVRGSNGDLIPGTKLFFGNEILKVDFAEETDVDLGNVHAEEHVETFQPYRSTITLDDEDEEVDFVVIDEFCHLFGPAVMHIKNQHIVGVGSEGLELYKNGRLCWLQIATKTKVYLFDILLLGVRAFKNGLATILESKHILKVIHDCRALSGCLINQFGVTLSNVFDTQVADVMCFYSQTGGFLPNRVSTLQEVVGLYLKVPSSRLSSLQMESRLTREEMEMWYKRPCPVPLLKVMVLSVIHLLPLRLVLLDAHMNDYVSLVDSYLNSSPFEPEALDHVSMDSVLELPQEFKQLDEKHRERQEQARSRYPITEQGLLARFNPHPPSESQTSVSSVDVHKPSNLFTESLTPVTLSNLEKDLSATKPLSKGEKEPQTDVSGRGPSSLPISPPQIPRDTSDSIKPSPPSLSALIQSFRSFRC